MEIVTKLNLPVKNLSNQIPQVRHKWSKTKWEVYQATLTSLLPLILCQLFGNHTDLKFNDFATSITTAIEQAMEHSTPTGADSGCGQRPLIY